MSKKQTNFGPILKKYLDSGAIQVKTLAEITGLSVNSIYLIRDGVTDPRESSMNAIAEALGYTLAEFISNDKSRAHTIDDCMTNIVTFVKSKARK